jgi:hypothetical protein
VITDRTKSHDRKKKVEKLSYLKKLQELKAKRSQNIKRRKSIEDGYKVELIVQLSKSKLEAITNCAVVSKYPIQLIFIC